MPAGGGTIASGSSGSTPSRRIRAWKCTAPRRCISAALPCDSRTGGTQRTLPEAVTTADAGDAALAASGGEVAVDAPVWCGATVRRRTGSRRPGGRGRSSPGTAAARAAGRRRRAGRSRRRAAVLADAGVAAGVAGLRAGSRSAAGRGRCGGGRTRVWTAPNDGAVKVANTAGCRPTGVGDAFAADEAGAQRVGRRRAGRRWSRTGRRWRGGCRTPCRSRRRAFVGVPLGRGLGRWRGRRWRWSPVDAWSWLTRSRRTTQRSPRRCAARTERCLPRALVTRHRPARTVHLRYVRAGRSSPSVGTGRRSAVACLSNRCKG